MAKIATFCIKITFFFFEDKMFLFLIEKMGSVQSSSKRILPVEECLHWCTNKAQKEREKKTFSPFSAFSGSALF